MKKDFDGWNARKKLLNDKTIPILCTQREVWWAAIGLNIGREQDGTGIYFDRPVIVLTVFNQETCLVVPLTTSDKRNKYYLDIGTIDGMAAAANISQLRLIDTRRLIRKVGFVGIIYFEEMRNAIRSLI